MNAIEAPFATVLLPGLACDAGMWQAQQVALGARFAPCVSDVHTRADSIAGMAMTLLADHPGELVLIGASMGGRVALEAARLAPHRVRGLALLGSTARADTDALGHRVRVAEHLDLTQRLAVAVSRQQGLCHHQQQHHTV